MFFRDSLAIFLCIIDGVNYFCHFPLLINLHTPSTTVAKPVSCTSIITQLLLLILLLHIIIAIVTIIPYLLLLLLLLINSEMYMYYYTSLIIVVVWFMENEKDSKFSHSRMKGSTLSDCMVHMVKSISLHPCNWNKHLRDTITKGLRGRERKGRRK